MFDLISEMKLTEAKYKKGITFSSNNQGVSKKINAENYLLKGDPKEKLKPLNDYEKAKFKDLTTPKWKK